MPDSSAVSVSPRRSSSARVVARVAAALLIAGAVLVVAEGLMSADPAAAAGCGPAPQGQIAVAVVVDRGSGTPTSRCVFVAQRSTGLDAMRAAGHAVRLDGGFVCGIDGLPATGCGNRPESGLAYWRYWHAAPGGAWTYSQVGAGGYRLPERCAVEGWVWSDSPSADTPPRVAAPSPSCAVPTTTAAPTTRPPAPAPGVAPAVPSGGSAPTGGASSAGGPTAPAGDAGAPAARGAAPVDPGTSPTPPVAVEGATTVAAGPESPDGGGDASAAPDGGAGRSDSDGELAGSTEDALAAGRSPAQDASTPWGVVIAAAMVAVLLVGTVLRSRARQAGAAGTS